MSAGLSLVSLITLILAFNKLKNQGCTSWDADGGFIVLHAKIGAGRAVLTFVLLAAYFLFIGALS